MSGPAVVTPGGTMDCRQVHQAYRVYLQGRLSPIQAGWIEEHIKDCPDCYLLDKKVRETFVDEVTRSSHENEGK